MMSSETRTVPSRPQRSPRSSPTSHNPHIPEQPSWSAPNMATSTPVSTHSRKLSPRNSPTFGAHNSAEVTISPLPRISEMENPELLVPDNVSASSFTEFTDPIHEVVIPGRVAVPILGYEVMEERARFTVFKIQVRLGPSDTWYIFRRYSDFDILNMKLKELFPHFRLSLPPKKWFGDNYDKNFLEDRMLGLQAFLNNIVGHHEVCNSKPVKEFFCFEEPPGPHDSLEESRALCETLESRVFELHHQLAERDARTALLEEELRLSQVQVDNLRKALKLERSLSAGHRPSSQTLLHIPEETVVPPSGDCEKSSQASSAVSNVESSTESTNLTSSLAAMETIRLTTVSREEAKAATTKPKSVRPKTENPQISNSLPKTVSSASKNTESVVTSHSTSSSPALRQTGPAQLRTTGAKHELSVGDVVAASSSPTPRVEMPGAIRNETRSAGAHSVDIKTSKNLNMNCVSDDSKLALASGVNNNVKYVENVQQNGLESKNKVVNMKKGLIPETG